MLIDKLSINVGETTTMYVELHDGTTPDEELKYGDCKWEDGKMLIWYGLDEGADMSGWVNSPWGANNYTGAILSMAANSKNNPVNVIYRIMNNDITFDEQKYNAIDVGDNDE